MSEISARAHGTILLADFALADSAGKLNVIGAGIAGLGFEATQGVTSRFTLVAVVTLPAELCPAEFVLEIALLDSAGEVVEIPGAAAPQKMRVGHVATMEKPTPPAGLTSLRDSLTGRTNYILDFGNGLPLAPGALYRWRLQIDGDETSEVLYPFAVSGPPAMPVLG